ncbi:MAG TPA: GerMN domain-containing protein [Acidimicrobiales bacterium]
MSRPRRAAMPTLLLALAAVLMAGCGLSHDDEAQPIAADKLPADLLAPSQPATSTTLPPSDTKPVTIYLLRGTSDGAVLVPVQREVAEPDRAGARIEALLRVEPTDAEKAQGLSSAIPDDVELLVALHDVDERELVIDLSQEFLDVQGTELTYRFAQIVFTAAELDGVRSIRFRVDGQAIQALDDAGNEQAAVGTSDYSALRPR